jgi:hypothetical protein
MECHVLMITTVTVKNRVTILAEIARRLGIRPGCRLDWQLVEGAAEILVRVVPDRGELARELAPERDTVAELIGERAAEGRTDPMPACTPR